MIRVLEKRRKQEEKDFERRGGFTHDCYLSFICI